VARWLAPPVRGLVPAAPPGSGAPSALLGAYGEPEAEPDMSVSSSVTVRLREGLAPALLVLRARSAVDCTGAVSHCSAECANVAAALPMARWNTRGLLWVTWHCACICAAARTASAAGAAAGCAALLCLEGPAAAAPARHTCGLRTQRSRAALRLAVQDLPRRSVQ